MTAHERKLQQLRYKKRVAEEKSKEWQLRKEIFQLYCPFKAKIKYSKLIIGLCITAIIIYTIVALRLQFYNGIEASPTLTTLFFGVFGVEFGATASIKIAEIIKNKKDDEQDNDISVG